MNKLPVGDVKISSSISGRRGSRFKAIVLEDSEGSSFFLHIKHLPLISSLLKSNYFLAEDVKWANTNIGTHDYIAPSHLVGRKNRLSKEIKVYEREGKYLTFRRRSYLDNDVERTIPRFTEGTFELIDLFRTRSTIKARYKILDAPSEHNLINRVISINGNSIFKKVGEIPKLLDAKIKFITPGILIAHVI